MALAILYTSMMVMVGDGDRWMVRGVTYMILDGRFCRFCLLA
jgi:hypothetical protein